MKEPLVTTQNQGKISPTLIRLTTTNYWQQLEGLRATQGVPVTLVDCLKGLVASHLHATIGPEATSRLIEQAKHYLKDGILLSDSVGDWLYDVMVFVPNGEEKTATRSFFRLIRKWPGGQLKYLEDIEQ